jgi:hypothetical protein
MQVRVPLNAVTGVVRVGSCVALQILPTIMDVEVRALRPMAAARRC